MPVIMTNKRPREIVRPDIEHLSDEEVSYRISKNLYNLRKQMHLTRSEASELIPINIRSLRDYEDVKMTKIPRIHMLMKLCRFYNVSLMDLFKAPSEDI